MQDKGEAAMRPSLRVLVVGLLLMGLVGGVAGESTVETVIDDFEDGDISEYNDNCDNGGVTTSTVYEGSYAAELQESQSSNCGIFGIYGNGLNYYPQRGDNVGVRYYVEDLQNSRINLELFDDSDSNGYRFTLSGRESELRIKKFNENTVLSSESIPSPSNYNNEWLEFRVNTTSTNFSFAAYDSSGNKIGEVFASDSDYSGRRINHFIASNSNDGQDWHVDYAVVLKANSNPTFDSVSSDPMSWTKGSNISVNYDASDSDGNVSSVCADVWENGTQIVTDNCKSYSSASVSGSFSDLFEVDQSDIYYNYTLTAEDDDGAVSTYSDSQFIRNEPPEFSISELENTTYFSYENNWTVSVEEDGDNVPNEEISCSTYLDGGNESSSFSGTEAYSESGSVSGDLGSHEFKVGCSDPAGNVRNKSVDFTVKAFEFTDSGSQSSVYETENIFFDSDFRTGSMVENVSLDLSWNGSVVNSSTVQGSGSVESLSETLYHTIPLAYTDGENVEWRYEASISYQGLDGNSSTKNFDSNLNSQTVDWSYYIENSSTVPEDGDYIETEDFELETVLHTETNKADIGGEVIYWRTGESSQLSRISNSKSSVYEGGMDVGKADNFNSSSFKASSKFTVSFKDRTRSIQGQNHSINVHRIQLFKEDPSGLQTAESLVFDTDYEEFGGDINTDVRMDISLWKNRDELVRRFSHESQDKQQHSFYIYPAWAEYSARTLTYPDEGSFDIIQYEPTYDGGALRSYFFPTTQTLSSDTFTVPLKTINRSETQEIDISVTDPNGDAGVDYICRIDRKFAGEGVHQTVSMFKTGTQGESRTYLEVNEIFYRITCYKNGEVVDVFGDQIMQNPLRLDIGSGDSETVLDYTDEVFDSSCSYNETSISCSYQTQSEQLQTADLKVHRNEIIQDIEVCSKTASTLTGGFTCSGLNTSENTYRYSVTGTFNGIQVPGTSGATGTTSRGTGNAGLLVTAIVFAFTLAASAFNVLVGIGLGTLSMIWMSAMNFIRLSPSQNAALVATAIILGWVLTE